MKNRFLPFLAGLICLALAGCGQKQDAGPAAVAPVPVEVAVAEERGIPLEAIAIGVVEPMASVQIKPKVGGEIGSVGFADGAYVKAGQVLFTIDKRPYEAAVKRAEANLVMAQAQAKNADEQLRRYTELSSKGAASREQHGQFVAGAESQKADVDARQADADQARLSLDWATVLSPIDGRAGAALVKAGNIVQANTEVLAVINQMQPIYISFSVPENMLGDIRRRRAEKDLDVTAFDADSLQALSTGKLSFVDNTVDRESGMVMLKATFGNEDESLWPGQFVDVRLRLAEDHGIVIPSVAVMDGQEGQQVFVVKDGIAELRRVKVERTHNSLSVIESGLAPGEMVITGGQLRVTSGGKVSAQRKREDGEPVETEGATARAKLD